MTEDEILAAARDVLKSMQLQPKLPKCLPVSVAKRVTIFGGDPETQRHCIVHGLQSIEDYYFYPSRVNNPYRCKKCVKFYNKNKTKAIDVIYED